MLEWKLSNNGFLAMGLTGDVSQSKRQRIIDDMKAGSLKILVATDVVARGLHVEDISHVYNYDLPNEAASYVHRIGRTARAGKSGKAYSLVCEDHAFNLPEIEKYIERKIPAEWIDEAEMLKDEAGPYRRRPSKPASASGRGGKGSSGSGRSSGGSQRGPRRSSGAKPTGSGSSGKGRGGSSSMGTKGTASSSKPSVVKQAAPKEISKEKKDIKTAVVEPIDVSASAVKNGSDGETSKENSKETRRPRRRRGRRGGASVKAKENSNEPSAAKGNGDARQARPSSRVKTDSKQSSTEGSGKKGNDPRRRSRSKPLGKSSRSSSPSAARASSSRKSPRSSRIGSTSVSSVGDSLIESQTGIAAASATALKSAPQAAVAKPRRGMLKRILNVFAKK
jgi:ATP-dependent RNA helicase RhlB